MKKSRIINTALVDAVGTAVYVVIVALFFYMGRNGFFEETSSPSVFIPIAMLMLFVFSAALTGFLVFGRPVMWYIDGKKKEAVSLLCYTLGIFLIITFVALILFIFR